MSNQYPWVDPNVCMRTYLSKRDDSERKDRSVEMCIAPVAAPS